MMEACIGAIEYALPSRRVTNEEMARLHPQWQMDQVALRAGVEARYWCGEGETALDLAEAAARRLATRVDIQAVDAILFCTQSPDYVMPPNACLLQHRLGLPSRVAALDYSLACSGYVYGLYLAKALIGSGAARKVLLVTAETYSKLMNPEDRGPAALFGDAAAATLVEAGPSGLGDFLLGTDGSQALSFYIPAGGARQPRTPATIIPVQDASGNRRTPEQIHMDGAAMLDFVKQAVPPLVKTLLAQTGLTLDDLDLVVFHQASKLILDFLHRALRVPAQKQFCNLARVGNTVSASIPIALRDAELQGVLKPGMKILVVGFGVGLSWGAGIIDWK